MTTKLHQPSVAKTRIKWTEQQLVETLMRHYGWNRAMLSDLFKVLRKDHT